MNQFKNKNKMKNFILIAMLFIGFGAANAQVTPMTATTGTVIATTGTVTNTGSVTLTAQIKGANNVVTIEYVATKVSGTVAGTATLYGSVDGVVYSAIPVKVIKGEVNAYTNTDVTTNSYVWTIQPSSYQYYRVTIVGSGTMVSNVTGTVLIR